jgi:hypothetical protein
MTEDSLSFLHFLNMHYYLEMICLYPLILQNVQAICFVRNMHIIKKFQLMLHVLFFSTQFMNIYITILQIIIISGYSPLNQISSDCTHAPI